MTADAAFAESTASQQTTATVGDAVSNDASAALRGSDDVASLTAPQASAPDVPTVETPLHHFYCVEYARLRSGLEIFGDAKTWWQRAGNLYAKFTQPAADAVMVFSGSARIARGHVAVVARIVSPREIRVDQANWRNRGEIDHNTPVLDVSAQNDWSRVRVWDIGSNRFGSRVYAIKGFIGRNAAQTMGS
ncbi:MAG: CHAP domain-containing protein [Rhizomicrobium sp.]